MKHLNNFLYKMYKIYKITYKVQEEALVVGRGCRKVEKEWAHGLEAKHVNAASRRGQLVNAASASYRKRFHEGHGTQAADGVKKASVPSVSAAQMIIKKTDSWSASASLTELKTSKTLDYGMSLRSVSSTFWLETGP